MTDEKCPRCKVGFIQRTALAPPDKGEAIGCTHCTYPIGEPGFSFDLSYDPMEVDEGWEPPYRNKNACLEQKLAKEIGEMSDEAVEVAVEKYFVKNPCNEIKVGVRDYYDLRSLYEGVLSRINKLEDDTRAAIEFADLAEDDRGTEMILEFCEDITKLVGE
jgi:hypothetical protein